MTNGQYGIWNKPLHGICDSIVFKVISTYIHNDVVMVKLRKVSELPVELQTKCCSITIDPVSAELITAHYAPIATVGSVLIS